MDNLGILAVIAGIAAAIYLGRYLLATLDTWHHDRDTRRDHEGQ